ncbi:MAG: DUF1778 domain-containing protein [Sphingobium sp.]|nr:DUF1778 domain-containing protein [Sphingobium sp.]
MPAPQDTMATASERSTVRMNFRTRPHIKHAIQQAAAWCGLDDSAFVMNAAYKAALDTIQSHERTIVSGKDFEAILNALDNPAPPSQALQDAFARHDQLIERR